MSTIVSAIRPRFGLAFFKRGPGIAGHSSEAKSKRNRVRLLCDILLQKARPRYKGKKKAEDVEWKGLEKSAEVVHHLLELAGKVDATCAWVTKQNADALQALSTSASSKDADHVAFFDKDERAHWSTSQFGGGELCLPSGLLHMCATSQTLLCFCLNLDYSGF